MERQRLPHVTVLFLLIIFPLAFLLTGKSGTDRQDELPDEPIVSIAGIVVDENGPV